MYLYPAIAIFALVAPMTAIAALPPIAIPPASFGPLCTYTGFCNTAGSGFLDLQLFLSGVVVPNIIALFIGIGVLYIAWYALNLIINGSEESTLSETKKAFGYAAMGMGIVGMASLMVDTFAPSSAGGGLVNPTPFAFGINALVDFITAVTGAFLVFLVGFSGFRIIALQGNESEIEKQRKNFFNGLLGIPVLLLARIIVTTIAPGNAPQPIVDEIIGMVSFLLEILAGLAVVAIIVSGLMFIVSLNNDTLKQRAKKILSSTIIILIIVMFSYTLVSTFIF